jgi:drug/metabolite transporter (DMT)-like permease
MSAPHPLLGGAVAILGAVAYGISVPAARMAGMAGVNGANIALQRSTLLVLILAIIIGFLGRSFRMNSGEEKRIVVMGVLAGLTGLCYLSSLNFVPVAIAAAMFYTFPLLLILASPFTSGGRITPWRIVAFVIAFAGIILCVGPTLDGLDWRGLALAFTASVSCAALFALTAKVQQDGLTLMFWTQVIALPVLALGVAATGLSPMPDIRMAAFPIILSALGFYLGFTCQLMAGRMLKPATLGLFFLIEPAVAITSAAVFLGETMLPLQYIGISLVIGGLALDVWKQGSNEPVSAA